MFGIDVNGVIYHIKIKGDPQSSFKYEFIEKEELIGYLGRESYFKFKRLATPDPETITLKTVINFTKEWTNNPHLVCYFPPLMFTEIFQRFDQIDRSIPYMRLSEEDFQLFTKEVHEITAALEKRLVLIKELENKSSIDKFFTFYRPYKIERIETLDQNQRFRISR